MSTFELYGLDLAIFGDKLIFVNSSKVLTQKQTLEALGYETSMIYVKLGLEGSIESDRQRGEAGGRSIGPELVTDKYNELEKTALFISLWKGLFLF